MAENQAPVQIRIGLPLPLDVTNTLNSLIGAVYPNAMQKMGTGYEMVIEVQLDDRVKTPSKRELAKRQTHLGELEGTLEKVEDDAMVFGTPAEASLHLAEICRAMLATDEAVNYMEAEAFDKVTGQRFVVTACRSKGQTPHALRMKAEAELTAAQEELRQLKLHHAALMRGHGKRIADEIRATIYPDERACQAAEIAESTIPEEIQ